MKAHNSPSSKGGSRPSGGHGTGPVRTCVACREEAGKVGLIRFVRNADGEVAADPTGRSPGRGAYVHPTAACLELARKRRAIDRALGASVRPEVWSQIEP